MGTPKKKHRRQKELVSPIVAEKIRLLEEGKKMSQELKVGLLPDFFGRIKDILLPLIPWLDKPIFPRAAFIDHSVPKVFQRRRGVRVFDSGIIGIWLERSGKWFLRDSESDHYETVYQEVDSQRLAEIMFQKSDYFLKRFSRDSVILEEVPFLKDIVFYNMMFVRFASQCFESVKVLVEAREKRLNIIKEWLNLLNEFGQSLDPLIGQGKNVLIKGYSIFEERKHGRRGTSRCTADYLCSEALNPFWEVSKGRHSRYPQGGEYREIVSDYTSESLEELLRRLSWICDEIKETGEGADANSLFGRSTGRLSLTEGEIVVLRELVNSIIT